MTALSVMLIGDTCAALIGRKLGRHKINRGLKSIEGSVAFFLSSSLILLFYMQVYNQTLSFLLFGTIGIVTATFCEIYENRIHLDDNFSIPLAVGLFLYIPVWL